MKIRAIINKFASQTQVSRKRSRVYKTNLNRSKKEDRRRKNK